LSYYRRWQNNERSESDYISDPALAERIQKMMDFNDEPKTDWEVGYLESLQSQFGKWNRLSKKQVEVLEKMEKKYSPDERKLRKNWEAEWDEENERIALICAQYYLAAGYFTDLAQKVVDSGGKYKMSPKQYKAMCENKYAQRVLAEAAEPHKYPVGSMVSVRASSSGNAGIALRMAPALAILEHMQGNITSAAKGAKKYKILPVGSAKTYVVEERDIKKLRKTKKTKEK
tara:strand:+ start:32 stop:721 length:690 start_codon:yes stop_codon:yes gene_type:complete